MIKKDIVVIGGGPAGLAAALKASKEGIKDVMLIERDDGLGGILNQCIHDGFGVEIFKEGLTGPEYAQRYVDQVEEADIEVITNSTVLEVTKDKKIMIQSPKGLLEVNAKAVIITTGCRERTREMIRIPGSRPAGVYSAGCAQNLINLLGYLPGRKIVILGSGDIGLIMARRLTLEGAKVLAVVEIMPYSAGLTRNIVQCLEDYDIPLILKHTVVDIKGNKRVEGVTIAEVDDKFQPIPGSEKDYDCDTLLLSVGLIPENELAEKAGVEFDDVTGGPSVNEFNETSVPGIYSAGNCLQVHDLVDWATIEAENAAVHAVEYVKDGIVASRVNKISSGDGVHQVVPQNYSGKNDLTISFRVKKPFENKNIVVTSNGEELKRVKHIKLNPAEMERIQLSKDDVKNRTELIIDVRD